MKTGVTDKYKSHWIICGCLFLTVLIGMTRYLTGPETAFSLFYLLPITLATKRAGYRSGVLISICSALTWLAADLSMAPLFRNATIPFINAALRLVVFLIVTRTIWALKSSVEEQRILALCDPLTKAANRRAFFDSTERALKMARRFGYPLSMLYVDLDHFKKVNDQLGHHEGDELLCIVTQCIRQHIREIDVLARMGGDEFCIVLIDSSPASASKVAHKLRAHIMSTMSRHQWPVAVSIGAATFTSIPSSVAEMVALCDRLMYKAKKDPTENIVHEVVCRSAAGIAPIRLSGGDHPDVDNAVRAPCPDISSKRAGT